MDARTLLLREKWDEVNDLPDGRFTAALDVCAQLWRPSDIFDRDRTVKELHDLEPTVSFVDSENLVAWDRWRTLRLFCSAAAFDATPARLLRFLVTDRRSGLVLGLLSLASDVPTVKARDVLLGWSPADRRQRLRHLAIASTIVPTQPFGHAFLGGKALVALLLSDPTVRQTWEAVYGDVLVGITTTSLFGSTNKGTQYDGTDFKNLGNTKGTILLAPDRALWRGVHPRIRTLPAYARIEAAHTSTGPETGIKQKELELFYRDELGLRPADCRHGHPRGLFFASLYDNTPAFLQGTIGTPELIPRQFNHSTVEAWRRKAEARYRKLHAERRLNPDPFFCHDLIGMTWEEAQKRYGTSA